MIPRTIVPAQLLGLAERQAWMLSRDQVLRAGLSDRVISRLIGQDWRVLAPGVYSLRSEPSWLGWCWAGLLLAGPGAALGLAAAAHLYRLMPAPDEMLIWVPESRQVRNRWPWYFKRGYRLGVGHPPRTTIVQTILELAAVQSTDALVNLLAVAVGRRGVTPDEIRQALSATARHPRRALLTELLADVGEGVRSPLERHYLHRVERAHGLPRAVRQESPAGRFQTDAWYLEYGVVVELDGRTYHDGPGRFRLHPGQPTHRRRAGGARLSNFIIPRDGWVRRRPIPVSGG